MLIGASVNQLNMTFRIAVFACLIFPFFCAGSVSEFFELQGDLLIARHQGRTIAVSQKGVRVATDGVVSTIIDWRGADRV
jgi:hypothetical protein